MKILYLDLISGISGDMFLGGLIDLGVDFEQLRCELARLDLGDYHLHATRAEKSMIAGTRFSVHIGEHHAHAAGHPAGPSSSQAAHAATHEQVESHVLAPDHLHPHDPAAHHHHHSHEPAEDTGSREHAHEFHRSFADIKRLISHSPYSAWVKTKAIAVFQRIALAEGKIHGCPPDQVHFHEVGAIDSIVDIVGACLALEMLGQPKILASAVTEGTGFIECAHGRFPIPAPATLAILGERRVALSQCTEPHELVTPTGAALLAEFVESFGPMTGLVAEKIAYGLGSRDTQTRPNVLRIIGSSETSSGRDWETDTVAVLETNLDDLNPELLGHFVDMALAKGGLDVFYTPIQMKKSRPGVLLTVLCDVSRSEEFAELMLRETSAFGVRRTVAERRKLLRQFQTVQTSLGAVTVKTGSLNGQILQAAPEFESCKQVAQKTGAPLRKVYEAALQALPKQV
jgi:pyridinium-3,5-bisthiocarboxylic acid mononucleotide nickel chelatase